MLKGRVAFAVHVAAQRDQLFRDRGKAFGDEGAFHGGEVCAVAVRPRRAHPELELVEAGHRCHTLFMARRNGSFASRQRLLAGKRRPHCPAASQHRRRSVGVLGTRLCVPLAPVVT